MPRWMQSREFRFTESFRSFLRGTLYMTSTHRRLRSSDSRACREDIRLLWLGETFPRLLFQTRYRVNCFVDLCPDQYFGAFARNREGDRPDVRPCEALDERLYTTRMSRRLARRK